MENRGVWGVRAVMRRILILTVFAGAWAAFSTGALAAEASSGGRGLADGKYAVDVTLSGGSGKAGVESPTLLAVEDGKYFARITWSSPNYDYMVVDGRAYYNQNTDGGNSSFLIPVLAFDEEMPVVADTVAMGAPHEIQYTLHFYSDSIGSKSSLPQEGAKRVLAMAALIIIVGGVLNYFTDKRRKRDYSGAKR